MRGADLLRDNSAWNDVVTRTLRNVTERNEHAEMVVGHEVLTPAVKNPRLSSSLIRLALNGDGARYCLIRGEYVNATRIPQRDGGDMTATG